MPLPRLPSLAGLQWHKKNVTGPPTRHPRLDDMSWGHFGAEDLDERDNPPEVKIDLMVEPNEIGFKWPQPGEKMIQLYTKKRDPVSYGQQIVHDIGSQLGATKVQVYNVDSQLDSPTLNVEIEKKELLNLNSRTAITEELGIVDAQERTLETKLTLSIKDHNDQYPGPTSTTLANNESGNKVEANKKSRGQKKRKNKQKKKAKKTALAEEQALSQSLSLEQRGEDTRSIDTHGRQETIKTPEVDEGQTKMSKESTGIEPADTCKEIYGLGINTPEPVIHSKADEEDSRYEVLQEIIQNMKSNAETTPSRSPESKDVELGEVSIDTIEGIIEIINTVEAVIGESSSEDSYYEGRRSSPDLPDNCSSTDGFSCLDLKISRKGSYPVIPPETYEPFDAYGYHASKPGKTSGEDTEVLLSSETGSEPSSCPPPYSPPHSQLHLLLKSHSSTEKSQVGDTVTSEDDKAATEIKLGTDQVIPEYFVTPVDGFKPGTVQVIPEYFTTPEDAQKHANNMITQILDQTLSRVTPFLLNEATSYMRLLPSTLVNTDSMDAIPHLVQSAIMKHVGDPLLKALFTELYAKEILPDSYDSIQGESARVIF